MESWPSGNRGFGASRLANAARRPRAPAACRLPSWGRTGAAARSGARLGYRAPGLGEVGGACRRAPPGGAAWKAPCLPPAPARRTSLLELSKLFACSWARLPVLYQRQEQSTLIITTLSAKWVRSGTAENCSLGQINNEEKWPFSVY